MIDLRRTTVGLEPGQLLYLWEGYPPKWGRAPLATIFMAYDRPYREPYPDRKTPIYDVLKIWVPDLGIRHLSIPRSDGTAEE